MEQNMNHLHSISPETLYHLTVKLYRAHDYENAHHCASFLRQIDPLNARSYKILGHVNQASGKFSWAIGAYQRVIIFDAMDTDTQYHMAQCYASLKEYPKAIKWLKACVAIQPDHQEAKKMLSSLEQNIC